MPAACSISACDKPARVRGWCVGHYERWRKHGDPTAGGPLGTRSRQSGPCSVDGCDDPAKARGLCQRHRRRPYKRSPAQSAAPRQARKRRARTPEEAREFFWANVDVRGPDECHPWQRTPQANGYGQFWDGERRVSAHVFAYELEHGPVPEGHQVHHTCHPPICTLRTRCPHRLCCNSRHLAAVTGRNNRMAGITARPGNGRRR
jgi:hypothetical protein